MELVKLRQFRDIPAPQIQSDHEQIEANLSRMEQNLSAVQREILRNKIFVTGEP
jgi:hypothetical protein